MIIISTSRNVACILLFLHRLNALQGTSAAKLIKCLKKNNLFVIFHFILASIGSVEQKNFICVNFAIKMGDHELSKSRTVGDVFVNCNSIFSRLLWYFSRKIYLGDETSVAYISPNSPELKFHKQSYFGTNLKLCKSQVILKGST